MLRLPFHTSLPLGIAQALTIAGFNTSGQLSHSDLDNTPTSIHSAHLYKLPSSSSSSASPPSFLASTSSFTQDLTHWIILLSHHPCWSLIPLYTLSYFIHLTISYIIHFHDLLPSFESTISPSCPNINHSQPQPQLYACQDGRTVYPSRFCQYHRLPVW